jgi:molybdopterin-guanine dinucleotide biosynthesis protein A
VLRGLTPHIFIVAQDARRLGRDVHVVADQIAGAGPMGGVYTALRASPVSRVVVLACDMPFVTREFLRWLAGRDPDADVVVPRNARGIHPLCAVYHVRIADRLQREIASGRLALHTAIDDCLVRYLEPDEMAPFDPDGRLLMNVNTEKDYADAMNAARHDPRPVTHDPRS